MYLYEAILKMNADYQGHDYNHVQMTGFLPFWPRLLSGSSLDPKPACRQTGEAKTQACVCFDKAC